MGVADASHENQRQMRMLGPEPDQRILRLTQARAIELFPALKERKIADSDPEPFTLRPLTPLGGVRALGFSHVIAGPGRARLGLSRGGNTLRPLSGRH